MKPNKLDKTQSKTNADLYFDTSKTAVIQFNKNKTKSYPFDSTYNMLRLKQSDIKSIDSLLLIAVKKYNNQEFPRVKFNEQIDLVKYNYRKQLVAAINKNGQRFVWVNNFCDFFMEKFWKPIWKKNIINTADGALCYFQFKINLDTYEIFDFNVNGSG